MRTELLREFDNSAGYSLVSRPRSSLHISSAIDDAGGVGLPRNIPDIPSSARLASVADSSPIYTPKLWDGALGESGDSHRAGSLWTQVGAGSIAGAVRDSIETFSIGASITLPMPGLGRVPYRPEATGFESSSVRLGFGQLRPRSDGRIQ